ALQVHAGRLQGQPRAHYRLAREVPLTRMLHDGTGGHIIDALPGKAILLDDTAQYFGEHFLVANLRVGTVAAREGDADATDNGDSPWARSDQHKLCLRDLGREL